MPKIQKMYEKQVAGHKSQHKASGSGPKIASMYKGNKGNTPKRGGKKR